MTGGIDVLRPVQPGSPCVEHFLYNLSMTEPLEAIDVYIGAGNVEETGHPYIGDVTEADIKA
jgi:hypothetical protein